MKKFAYHPLLFAIFPALSLYVHNDDQLRFREIVWVFVAVVILALIVWGVILYFVKHKYKAAIIATVFFILFFAFGHVIRSVSYLFSVGGVLEEATYLIRGAFADKLWLLLWGGMFVLLSMLVIKYEGKLKPASQFLNVLSVGVILTVAVNWGWSQFLEPNAEIDVYIDEWQEVLAEQPVLSADLESDALPDIYYIILDGLGREDILQDYYQLDISAVTTSMKEAGFFIASESQSNYAWTELSLTSSLNFMYLNDLTAALGSEASNTMPLEIMIENNRLFEILRRYDYKIVSFADEYEITNITSADTYLSPKQWVVNAFQNELLNITPVPSLLRLLSFKSPYDFHREHILYMFENLAAPRTMNGPSFVFAHFMAPHPPFVFGSTGEFITPDRNFSFNDGIAFIAEASQEEYVQSYREQATFITQKLAAEIEKIISGSSRPVIIIVQGDHGPGSNLDWASVENTDLHERMSIFNAYYFPDQDYTLLSDDVTPVNTFRVVLNQYFGGEFELLEKNAYFTVADRPYDFIDVSAFLSEQNNSTK